jgi:hypothetical protein
VGRLLCFFVPLTLPTSNSFYENVDELCALKETLIQQGILSNDGSGLAFASEIKLSPLW